MAAFQADTGLTGSVVGGLFAGPGAGAGSAVSPPRTFVPEGPVTVTGAAYGGASAGVGMEGTHALISGIVAFALLAMIWVTLPR